MRRLSPRSSSASDPRATHRTHYSILHTWKTLGKWHTPWFRTDRRRTLVVGALMLLVWRFEGHVTETSGARGDLSILSLPSVPTDRDVLIITYNYNFCGRQICLCLLLPTPPTQKRHISIFLNKSGIRWTPWDESGIILCHKATLCALPLIACQWASWMAWATLVPKRWRQICVELETSHFKMHLTDYNSFCWFMLICSFQFLQSPST